jgi:hypothetical protein
MSLNIFIVSPPLLLFSAPPSIHEGLNKIHGCRYPAGKSQTGNHAPYDPSHIGASGVFLSGPGPNSHDREVSVSLTSSLNTESSPFQL